MDFTTSNDDLTIVNWAQSPKAIIFNNEEGEQVGKLSWENDIFAFEGKAEESAKIFFDFLKGLIEA